MAKARISIERLDEKVGAIIDRLDKKDAQEEILRTERHALRDLVQSLVNRMSVLTDENKEIKEVVKSNTCMMNEMRTAFLEANITLKTLLRFGKFITWVVGLMIAFLTLKNLLGY